MSDTKRQKVQEMVGRRERNLTFFQKEYPQLYRRFRDLEFKRVEVQASAETGDLDIKVDGVSRYNGNAEQQGEREAKKFLSDCAEGSQVNIMNPPIYKPSQEYEFSSKYLTQSTSMSRFNGDRKFQGAFLKDFIPSVVFLGVGLGIHIDKIMESRDVIDVVVFEPDPEVFAASLFTVDWEKVWKRVKSSGNGDLLFSIMSGSEDRWVQSQILETKLQSIEPIYPVCTIYHCHKANSDLRNLLPLIGKSLKSRLHAWGNFDDELIRVNNVTHNIRRPIKILSKSGSIDSSDPVVIVGSGPSLDDRIDDLKRVRDGVTVVSSGTSLKVLISHGINPDYHVELDPKYTVYAHLSELPRAELAKTKLLATLDVNPLVVDLFESCFFYAKEEHPVPEFLGIVKDRFKYCHPTCTNAAASIFTQLGFCSVFLFGCDYGFKKWEYNHSKLSIWGNEEESETSKAMTQRFRNKWPVNRLFEVPSVDGDTVYTHSGFYSAKQFMELKFRYFKGKDFGVAFWNCSDGAMIESVPWLDSDSFMSKYNEIKGKKKRAKGSTVKTDRLEFTEDKQRTLISTLKAEFNKQCLEIAYIASQWEVSDARGAAGMGRAVVAYNLRQLYSEAKGSDGAARKVVGMLLGGMLRRFVAGGFSHALALPDEDVADFLVHSKRALVEFLSEAPQFVDDCISLERPMEDDVLVASSPLKQGA